MLIFKVPVFATIALAAVAQEENAKSGRDGVVTVVARGIGIDAEAAKKDALVNAIQQVVGLYVDAETLVQNETLVREKILTFANADVKSQSVLSVGKEEGLFRVTMKVGVVPSTLAARLRSNGVATRELSGELLAKLFGDLGRKEAVETDQAKSLSELLAGCAATSSWKAEIIGDPLKDLKRIDEQTAGVVVQFRIGPDPEDWSSRRDRLAGALSKASPKEATRNFTFRSVPVRDELTASFQQLLQLKEPVEWMQSKAPTGQDPVEFVAILNQFDSSRRKTMTASWNFYRAPKGTGDELEALNQSWNNVRVEVRLLDGAKGVVQATEMPLNDLLKDIHIPAGFNAVRAVDASPFEVVNLGGLDGKRNPFGGGFDGGGGMGGVEFGGGFGQKKQKGTKARPPAPIVLSLATPFLWIGDKLNRNAVMGAPAAEVELHVSRASLTRIQSVQVALVADDDASPRRAGGNRSTFKGGKRK